jgi:hypothetical protein
VGGGLRSNGIADKSRLKKKFKRRYKKKAPSA